MAPFSGSPKIPNWCERRYLLIVSFVVWPKSQIQNSLLILGHWRINDTTALSLRTRLRYFSHLHILQINILKCCPPPIAWVSPPWAHITSTISVFVPFSSSMFSWSTTQPPVMQLRDIAEKLDESREGHGREREREREKGEASDENPVTAALITRAQAFVLSAEKRASRGKCVFRTRLIRALLPRRMSAWMPVH